MSDEPKVTVYEKRMVYWGYSDDDPGREVQVSVELTGRWRIVKVQDKDTIYFETVEKSISLIYEDKPWYLLWKDRKVIDTKINEKFNWVSEEKLIINIDYPIQSCNRGGS